jgi:hypothetical protein
MQRMLTIVTFTWSGPQGVAVMPCPMSLESLTPCNPHDCRSIIITLTQPVKPSKQCQQALAVPPKLASGYSMMNALSRMASHLARTVCSNSFCLNE